MAWAKSYIPLPKAARRGGYAYQEIRIIRKVGFALTGRKRVCVRPRPINIGLNACWSKTRHSSAFADFPDNPYRYNVLFHKS